MPEPVSTLSSLGLAGLAAVYALARPASAVSDEANFVQRVASRALNHVEQSQALFGEKANCISHLIALASECSQDGWDGGDAKAVDPRAVDRAIDFIRALPDSLPLPEFAPEPDGAVSLDWGQSRNRWLSISVSASERLAVAWVDGADRGHGVARFTGDIVPARIIGAIVAMTGTRDASIRTE
jgi:hypothetical protein